MFRVKYRRAMLLAAASVALTGCVRLTTAPGLELAAYAPAKARLATLRWQEEARNRVAAGGLSPLAAARVYAALSVAQHRALRHADGTVPGSGDLPSFVSNADGRARYEARRGAVAGASAQVLKQFFPAAAEQFEAMVVELGGAAGGLAHPLFTRGVALGRDAGNEMVLYVQNDGFTAPWTGTVPSGPGIWVPNALPPAGGMFGQAKSYYLTSGSQFRPAAPPAVGSEMFNTDLAEVVSRTQNRTAGELAIAHFWDSPSGTHTPVGYWNELASKYAEDAHLNEREATQLFANAQAAMYDALIACWDAKYHYWFLRPSQASASVSLAFGNPNHPSYPSGHSCVSSAAANVLAHYFPAKSGELSELLEEASMSRLLAGIHYRFDMVAGKQIGDDVAALALEKGAP